MEISKRVTAAIVLALAGTVLLAPTAFAWESNNHKWGEGKETRRFNYVSGTRGGIINLTGCRTNSSRGFKNAKIIFWKHVSLRPDTRITSWTNECNTDEIVSEAGRGTYYFELDNLNYGDLLTIKKLTID